MCALSFSHNLPPRGISCMEYGREARDEEAEHTERLDNTDDIGGGGEGLRRAVQDTADEPARRRGHELFQLRVQPVSARVRADRDGLVLRQLLILLLQFCHSGSTST